MAFTCRDHGKMGHILSFRWHFRHFMGLLQSQSPLLTECLLKGTSAHILPSWHSVTPCTFTIAAWFLLYRLGSYLCLLSSHTELITIPVLKVCFPLLGLRKLCAPSVWNLEQTLYAPSQPSPSSLRIHWAPVHHAEFDVTPTGQSSNTSPLGRWHLSVIIRFNVPPTW